MIPPPLLQPPADKSFSFIARIQGLQVHGPQKGKRGWRGGVGLTGVEEGMGKRMVSQEIREEGTETPPLPWLNLSIDPSPLPPSHPGPGPSLPLATLLFCSTALPHVRGVQTTSGAAWRYQAFLGVRGRGRGAAVAEWPCGGTGAFLLNQ
ncbi:unnamed protein product [Pleuronectes platessa]|uniref:Uncharacterized protein n=1 Tax=Pleuronectes platessa TaxID=8262 RepID=A0A9N7VZ27_PLEPL|nr:unnamed protein product [Pleuronectes platessa]